jgi:hypothetical protein
MSSLGSTWDQVEINFPVGKQTNTLSPSPKGFQSPKFSDSDFREVRRLGLGLGRLKSSAIWRLYYRSWYSNANDSVSFGRLMSIELKTL